MKWVEISKAKVRFDQSYLVHSKLGDAVATLDKSETTATGVRHSFKKDDDDLITDATHIALISNPTEE